MSSSNLTGLVVRVGGALAEVARMIDSYADKKYPIKRRSLFVLARIIDPPQQYSKPNISLLIDAFSFHGIKQYKYFVELTDKYGLDTVYLGLDYLYEVGLRDNANQDNNKYNSLLYLHCVVYLINRLRANDVVVHGIVVDDAESLDYIVHELGLFHTIFNMKIMKETMESIDDAINDMVGKPNGYKNNTDTLSDES